MECEKTFYPDEILYEEVPENMSIDSVSDRGIEKCPHCGYLHFMGFEIEK
jgi:hypothetical protein